ncbi:MULTISPECIES: hypothetical protein [Marinobacter]|uniref:DUF2157 domain-containing protein n=1 Tax=Marinobacter xiaoshiensis TaxID=3073652 RepID=A0ABU2HKG9_9GAMM|nr:MULTISPECIES: hypothetical protein [unclassified Marinobacter]MBK1874198.1 hypothetical protein [Marinobacter sp. 1-3A]MDS1311564.1 hypothetical protein [Marinobacter sp. F60267]
MDYQIKELMKQGLSRNEIFEQLRKQSGNQMRLANKIATFEPGSSSRRTVLLNRVLLTLCLLQACFGIWVIYSNVVPMDEEFGWQGIVATFILTIFYFVGLFRMSFTGYASFILLCISVAAGYVYFFNYFPVVSVVGVLLAISGGALSYSIKVRLFPHMGFMDVKKDENGTYIFE